METNKKNDGKLWTDVYADKEELQTKLLNHMVSPLEMAAADAGMEAFVYEMDGIRLWISEKISRKLVEFSYEKIKFNEVLTQKLIESLGDITSEFAAFLNTPITDHKLSTRCIHALKGNDCGIMLDVAMLGRKGVSRIRNIGQNSIKEIRNIFIRNGCVDLFDDPMPTNTRQWLSIPKS